LIGYWDYFTRAVPLLAMRAASTIVRALGDWAIRRRPKHCFWLQTSTDRFYPDFVCELTDGRFLVVEHKGFDRWSDDDSKEKRNIGRVWEEKSDGQCLFVMTQGPAWNTILAKLA
jgi:type III restriction enzyme